jgi:hypothetical protein
VRKCPSGGGFLRCTFLELTAIAGHFRARRPADKPARDVFILKTDACLTTCSYAPRGFLMHRNHLKEAAWFPSYDGCHAKGPVPTLGHPAVPPSPHLRESLKALLPCSSRATGRPDPNTATDIPHPSPHALGLWYGNPTQPTGLRPGPPGPSTSSSECVWWSWRAGPWSSTWPSITRPRGA